MRKGPKRALVYSCLIAVLLLSVAFGAILYLGTFIEDVVSRSIFGGGFFILSWIYITRAIMPKIHDRICKRIEKRDAFSTEGETQ